MSFIEALFAIFISTTGVPAGCDGLTGGFLPDSIQVCDVPPAAAANAAESKQDPHGKSVEDESNLRIKKVHQKISNGF